MNKLEQNTNNATTWIGSFPGVSNDVSKGQTFTSPTEGEIQTIEVFSSLVPEPGKVLLTLHNFDTETKTWGPSLGSSSVDFKKEDTGKWVAFNLPALRIIKGKTYGFKLEGNNSFVGIGEAAGSFKQPAFSSGQEWKFSGSNNQPDSFTYFSLAFKVGLRA